MLASFLKSIPRRNGWWYRLPEKSKDDKNKITLATDTYLPHFGAIFGLTEEAMVVILAETGLIKTFEHNNNSKIIRHGWDNVKALFGVDQELEIDRSNLYLPYDGKKISKYFVKRNAKWRSMLDRTKPTQVLFLIQGIISKI